MKTVCLRTLLLASVLLPPALAGNQILLRNWNSADGTPAVVAAAGDRLYVLATLASGNPQITRIVQMDLAGKPISRLDVPQLLSPRAAVTDSQGNLILVGQGQAFQGIVVKADAQLHGAATLASPPATINAVAADASGNIFLTGSTSSAQFPITAGAYQSKPPLVGSFGEAADAFLMELSPGGAVVYSTYFGSDATTCLGGSFCVGKYGVTDGTAIAVDASGGVVIAGVTTASGLPTTAGALAPTCNCGYSLSVGGPSNSGFVARFQPAAAQQLVWSTFLNAGPGQVGFSLNGMALDPAGDVIVGGAASGGLPTTGGVFQAPGLASSPNGGGFLLKIDSGGTAAVWGTYLGGPDSAVQAVLLDSQGRVVFSGFSGNPSVPELQYKPTFVGRATSDGRTLVDFYSGPEVLHFVGPSLALTSTGGFASVVESGALWIETAAPGPSLLNVANSASGQYAGWLSPVQLITLYGAGIGPDAALNGELTGGVYTKSLGGYQVLFNGAPAPLLYAGSGQINTVVPAGAGGSMQIQVVTPAGTIDGPAIPVTYAPTPGIFGNWQTGLAAALNQDGSINSLSNPAGAGTIVTIFADANSGQFFPDGSLVPLAVYDAAVPVWVVDSYRSLAVVWAGAAPGIVNGVMQINFRLPDMLPPDNTFAFSTVIGGVSSAQNRIAVRAQ